MEDTELLRFHQLVECADVNINAVIPGSLQTPLLSLCQNNKSPNLCFCLKTLLSRKEIDLELKDCFGHTALTLLCRHYHLDQLFDCIRLLIQSGIKINTKNAKRQSALTILCEFYSGDQLVDLIRLLFYYSADNYSIAHSAEEGVNILMRRNLLSEAEILTKIIESIRYDLGNNSVMFIMQIKPKLILLTVQ